MSLPRLSRRQFVASAMCSAVAAPALAQGFPNKPIRIVVPYAAGGGSDVVARLIGQKLTEALGWTVVIENKAGASGLIGTEAAAKAAPDGYTLLLADTAHALNAALRPHASFDAIKDFAPLTLVGSSPQLLVAHPSLPASSLKQLMALPREQVRNYSVGSPGLGSAPHLLLETLKLRTNMQLVHLPYRGGAMALSDAVGGQVQMVINSMPACMPHVDSGRLKVLAIASPTRNPRLPKVQTFGESVLGLLGSAWYCLMAPAQTPPEVLQTLGSALDRVLQQTEVKARLFASFIDVLPGGPQPFARFLGEEVARWQAVVKQTGFALNG